MRKKIGIVGYFPGPGSFGITKPYMQFFQNFGKVVLISPWDKEIDDTLDLLVLPGGPDVDPFRYLTQDDELSMFVGPPCWIREKFDRELLPKYVENQTPIFGICRGLQTLSVFFGAKLNQHIWEHETTPDHERTKLVHHVKVHPAANLIPGLEFKRFEVNSLHHQTVANRPENASILFTYDGKHTKGTEDGDIEGLTWFPNYPAHAVQWHPEEIYDKASITLINSLLYPKK